MATVPALSGGDTAVGDVEELILTLEAATEPNLTAVTDGARKFSPLILTFVLPVVGPVLLEIFATVGGSGRRASQLFVSSLQSRGV